MSAQFLKNVFDKLGPIKRKKKKGSLYYWLRDQAFLREQRKEKRIEAKRGLLGMIEYEKKWYKSATKQTLNLEDPKTFTEKQQWLKFYDQDPRKPIYSDKYLVRKHIEEIIGRQYLIPLISIDGVEFFEDAEKIDFNKLPNSFVLSCNHGSSMTILVKDKSKLSNKHIKRIKKQLNRWLTIELAYVNSFDFTYKGIKPGIIISQYLEDNSGSLCDYKFMCFNGRPEFFWIDSDRFSSHKRGTYSLGFEKLPFSFNEYQKGEYQRPENLELMIELAKKLCKGFILVRIDFYNINGSIYFGEMTFNSEAGKEHIHPKEYNLILGEKLNIGK